MKPNILVTRAIAGVYAAQLIRPIILWTGIGLLILLLFVAFLAFQFSHWWWLMAAPLIIIASVISVLWLIIRFLLARLTPELTTEQREKTKQFVDKAQTVTENVRTPYFILIFYVIRDIIARRESGFVQTLIDDSKSLKPDFETLRKLF